MSEEIKCAACGCSCNPQPMDDATPTDPVQEEEKTNDDASDYHEETKLAVLIALVPAMTMTVFNLMGLI